MNRIAVFALTATLATVAGCNTGTGSGSSTNPNKPGDTRKLTVTVKEAQTITQNGTDDVLVDINRDNFKGPVTLSFGDLPSGVTVVTSDLTIPADKSMLTVTFKADEKATPVNDHAVKVTAKAKDESGMSDATTTFKYTVKAK